MKNNIQIESYHKEFVSQAIFRIAENPPRIMKCLRLLSEDQLWLTSNESSNSIANLILHVCGNIRQYIMMGVDNQPDSRRRDQEFSITSGMTSDQLVLLLNETIEEAVSIIRNCDIESMTEVKSVQVYKMSVIGIILHVTEHLSYHTGQIAIITKSILNEDLGFYEDVEL